jgi:2-polyprenyl-3-methyl-5-hydroxy-6-metoxy-1,4-benzoquinol methylase
MPLDEKKLEFHKQGLSAYEINRLDLYVNEAKFIYSLIEKELNVEPMNFYEIGSGIGLLSRMVADKGHTVIATEPATSGFGVVKVLQKVIEKSFNTETSVPVYYSETAEDLFITLQSKHKQFNYIFCANVIEHVINLPKFFDSIIPLISQNGTFRFVCPNYAIPYEPHFGFITLFSKKLTFKFQKRKILEMEKQRKENLVEFYNELSFPNIQKINKILKKRNCEIIYSRSATLEYVKRATNDKIFVARKKIITFVVSKSGKLFPLIIKILPKSILPIIDCRIRKLRLK